MNELIRAMEQIERLSREADPKLVDVPAMLGDIARKALENVKGLHSVT
jgi:hypothetical protein